MTSKNHFGPGAAFYVTKKYAYLDGDGPRKSYPGTGLGIDVNSELDFNDSINFNEPAENT